MKRRKRAFPETYLQNPTLPYHCHTEHAGSKKEEKDLSLSSIHFLFRRIELVFPQAAGGANPVFGNVFPGRAGGYAVVGVAQGGVIDIAAGALVFHGNVSSYLPK